jgi:uncharacterized membrane protein (UPF0182 family)
VRIPTDDRPRRRLGVRGWAIAAVVLLFILLASLRGFARFFTDYLWFKEVGFTGTWRGLIGAKAIPALVFTVTFFVIMLANLVIADRLAPRYRSMGPEDEMIERYRQAVAPFAGRIRAGIALFFALIAGAGVSSRWQEWVLFRNRVDFGVKDPQFHRDIGFYVFELPFIRFALEWTFVSLLVVLVVVAVFHYVNGGIRIQSPFQRVTPQVKAHLSVILAVMALVKTAQYWFDRFELNYSTRGTIDGASYTDVHAQLPALRFLLIISVFAAVLFIVNIWQRGWVLPVIAVGLWGLISIIIGTIYPAYIQRFQVKPNEFAREEPYIARNIKATRAAFGLQDVQVRTFRYEEPAPTDAVRTIDANQATLSNVRLWDPEQMIPSLKQLQTFRPFYDFVDVDIDRYQIGGESVPTLLSLRELNPSRLPSSTWINSHLVYTHGYGAVAAKANDVQAPNNTPDFLLSDLPPKGRITMRQPSVYYGENVGGYVIARSKQGELRPAEAEKDTRTHYTGSGGVPMSGALRRFAFFLRFNDVNMLFSSQITSESRAMYYRDIRERVEKAAPFLQYDSDPYPVILGNQVLWVLDGYTTTTRYPYSQALSPEGLPGSSGLNRNFNYVRNSVKVTVDAYTGKIHFYVIDPRDPLVRAWRKAFPDLFDRAEAMPAGLEEHFRYPQDLFKAQTEHYTIYHMTDPQVFYNKEDIWDVAPSPGSSGEPAAPADTGTTATTRGGSNGGRNETLRAVGEPSEPIYQVLEPPGERSGQQFVEMRPFVPRSTHNQLSAFMMAKSDPGHYGDLVVYLTPTLREAPSPTKVANQIEQDTFISQQFSLLDQRGSQVIRGQVQLIPVGNTIVYARPIYVLANNTNAFPRFRFLAVSYGDRSVLAADIRDGLDQIFRGRAPRVEFESGVGQSNRGGSQGTTTTTTTTTVPSGNLGDDVRTLLNRAAAALDQAQAALEAGDLGQYQAKVEEARRYVARANEVEGAGTAPTTVPPVTTSTTTTTAPREI